MWQRLSAVRMLIEHVYPSDTGVDPENVETILKLWKVINKGDHSKYVFPSPLKPSYSCCCENYIPLRSNLCSFFDFVENVVKDTLRNRVYSVSSFHIPLMPSLTFRSWVIGPTFQRQSP